RRRLL
ncbi:tfoX N-terminal domain protein, partial [Vibrio parahaemolyticus VPTS-2010_2]